MTFKGLEPEADLKATAERDLRPGARCPRYCVPSLMVAARQVALQCRRTDGPLNLEANRRIWRRGSAIGPPLGADRDSWSLGDDQHPTENTICDSACHSLIQLSERAHASALRDDGN
jgi:hypothetical protein